MDELVASQKEIVYLKLDHGTRSEYQSLVSGCGIIEVSFPTVFRADIDVISFRNFYVASLSVKGRFKRKGRDPVSKWRTVISNLTLMPHPYTDQGGMDSFTLRSPDFQHPLRDVSCLRFIIRQPCPGWREFRLEDLTFSRYFVPPTSTTTGARDENVLNLSHLRAKLAVSRGREDETGSEETSFKAAIGEVSTKLGELWALSAFQSASQSEETVGNYEKDGVYEGNLLAYS